MLGGCGLGNPLSSGYQEAPCPREGIQIAYFGQSNSANSVTRNSVKPGSSAPSPANLFQYDWRRGRCYRYREPLLGADGSGGNSITFTAVELARTFKGPVTIIPFGVSRSSVLQWAFGPLALHQEFVLFQARNSGLSPSIFLWHQGETDARLQSLAHNFLKGIPLAIHWNKWLDDRGRHLYGRALLAVMERSRRHFPASYFGIALASRCSSTAPWPSIRQAQMDAAQNNHRTFISADSDGIFGDSLRYDGCHFSIAGSEVLGRQYSKSLKPILSRSFQHKKSKP